MMQSGALMIPALLLLLLASGSPRAVVQAFPTAAGSCPAGEAAVGSSHLFTGGRNETTGTLEDGGFVVWLNGVPLNSDASFRIGQAETIEITGNSFRGFLIRVGGPKVDLTAAIQPVSANDTETQIAEATCVGAEGVGGLTHTGNTDKRTVSGILLVEEDISSLTMDITVVGQNDNEASSYWYSNFEVNAIVEEAPVTPSTQPSLAPTIQGETVAPTNTPIVDEETPEGESEQPPKEEEIPSEGNGEDTTEGTNTDAPSSNSSEGSISITSLIITVVALVSVLK